MVCMLERSAENLTEFGITPSYEDEILEEKQASPVNTISNSSTVMYSQQ